MLLSPDCCTTGSFSEEEAPEEEAPVSSTVRQPSTTLRVAGSTGTTYGRSYRPSYYRGYYGTPSLLTHPGYACYPGNIYNLTLCPASQPQGSDDISSLPGLDPLWVVLVFAAIVVAAFVWVNRIA